MSGPAQNHTQSPSWDPWGPEFWQRPESPQTHAWSAPFFLSLFAHVLLAATLTLLWSQSWGPFAPAVRKPSQTVWIDLAAPPAVAPTPRSQRIVESEPGRLTDRPAPDALLGERSQTVDRETVSRRTPTAAARASQKVRPAAQKAPTPQAIPQAPSLSQLGVSWNKPGQILNRPAAPQPQWASQGTESAAGNARPSDFIKGMKEGEQTALNTREFVFYGYFQRIRSSLDRAWNKTLRENLARFFRRGRRLASEVDHTTRTLVVLNGQGRVLRVQILEESGTLDLDDAAIRAFNEAGPFPNPPRGLIDPSGEIQVRWDFVLRN